MKRLPSVAMIFILVVFLAGGVAAGQRQVIPRSGRVSRQSVPVGPNTRDTIYGPGYPGVASYYPPYFYPSLSYSPIVVISPYYRSCFLPPALVVTLPFFGILHNDAFVSRAGLLDHLSGMHRTPLDAAASFYPHGAADCVFPPYQ
jgi:hypothetical protein